MKFPRSVRFAALAASLLLVAGCSVPSTEHAAKRSCCVTNLESVTFTDRSLYQLDSTWTTDDGRSQRLGVLRGRVQVVAMFFASCTSTCPLIVHNMKRIEAALPEGVRGKVNFALVSIDPERDTPKVLRAYRRTQQLPTDHWSLLHGTSDDSLELAALLGVKYKRETNGQFAHSNLITVLNAEGEIVYQQAGLNQDIGETVKAIERAAQSRPPTTSSP